MSAQRAYNIWVLFVKYIYIDRYCKMYGLADRFPGTPVSRYAMTPNSVGKPKLVCSIFLSSVNSCVTPSTARIYSARLQAPRRIFYAVVSSLGLEGND